MESTKTKVYGHLQACSLLLIPLAMFWGCDQASQGKGKEADLPSFVVIGLGVLGMMVFNRLEKRSEAKDSEREDANWATAKKAVAQRKGKEETPGPRLTAAEVLSKQELAGRLQTDRVRGALWASCVLLLVWMFTTLPSDYYDHPLAGLGMGLFALAVWTRAGDLFHLWKLNKRAEKLERQRVKEEHVAREMRHFGEQEKLTRKQEELTRKREEERPQGRNFGLFDPELPDDQAEVEEPPDGWWEDPKS